MATALAGAALAITADLGVAADLLEHVRVRQNQHLQFGNNRGCAEDAVTMTTVATPVRRFGRCGCEAI
jgi:hypothetical protein